MKNLLIIANLYHASPRIPGLATYLNEFGWRATIVTPPLGEEDAARLGFPSQFGTKVSLVEVPYRGDIFWIWRKALGLWGFRVSQYGHSGLSHEIRAKLGISSHKSWIDRLKLSYEALLGYPDAEKAWIPPALKTVSRLLSTGHFDALLSSSPYPTNHVIAERLKRRSLLPWIADFRDPWTQNHCYPYGPIRKHFEVRLEKRLLRRCDLMIAATLGYAKKQEDLHQRSAAVITNGFDPKMFAEAEAPLTPRFTITYAGRVYPEKQDPSKVLCALRNLIGSQKIASADIEMRFFGPEEAWVRSDILDQGLSAVARQCGQIPRADVPARLRESHLLLLLNWEDPRESGVAPGKFFEYLGAQRPILATGGFRGSFVEQVLSETKAGRYVTTVEEIEEALLRSYEGHKRTGQTPYEGTPGKVEGYGYPELARQLAELLNRTGEK